MVTKEEFAREHIRRAGNLNPSEEAIEIYLDLIETDPWINSLYLRANRMTAESYNAIPFIEEDKQ